MKKITFLLFLIFSLQFAFGQEDLSKASEYFNQAKQYTAENNFDKAIESYDKASAIFKAHNQTQNYIISELSLSELLINIGEIPKAEPKLSAIQADAISLFGEKSKVVAQIYNLQGRIAFMTSQIEIAKAKMNKALQIKIELFGEESVEAAMNMNDLALVYSKIGQIDSAVYFYVKNINIIKKTQGDLSPLLPTSYINLSNLFITLGQYDDAIKMKNKVIEIVTATQGEITPEVGEAYSGLGNVYIVKGEYKIAEDYLLKSNEIFTQIYGSDNLKIATNYINLGNIYSNTDNYDYALQYYFLATKILEVKFSSNPELPSLYNNIGLVCRKQGNYQNAEIFFNKAIDAKQNDANKFNYLNAAIYSNLGSVYREKKDPETAMEYFKESIEIFTHIYGIHNPQLVNPHLNIANIYLEQSNPNSALLFFQKSIIANSKTFENENFEINPPLEDYFDGVKYLEAINGKATIYMNLYESKKDTTYLNKALNNIFLCDTLITQLRKSMLSKDDKLRLNSEISNVFDNAVEICNLIELEGYRDDILELLFYFIERNKTSTLLQSIADAKANKFSDIPDSLVSIEKDIKMRINNYNQKIASSTTYEETNFYRNKLMEENDKYQEIIELYKTKYPSYYNAKFNVTLSNTADIQAILDDKTAVINYYISKKSLFAYVITKDNKSVFFSKLTFEEHKDVKRFNELILSYHEKDILEYEKLAYKIYEEFFFFQIPPQIEKLVIIPDEFIGTVPFDALFYKQYDGEVKDYKNYPFLINQYQISYSYSATLFKETNDIDYSSIERKDIFAIAPVFKPDNPQMFNDNAISTIIGTETEVSNIVEIFGKNKLPVENLMNKQANEYRFKSELQKNKYKILHIATHGFVNFENPDLSALIFSNDDLKIDDGILYSGEIYNMSLPSDLVILSACETARGKFSKGEGVIGLSRAFIYAGTKNLMISLWKVADLPTTELMKDFYIHLLDENKKLEGDINYNTALHEAKLDMINSKYGHPFFWSSFILIGE